MLAYKEGDKTHSVYESLICNEFLEDHLSKEQPLLPEHPIATAHDRIIIDSFSSKFVPLFYRILLRQVGEATLRDAARQPHMAKVICCISSIMFKI